MLRPWLSEGSNVFIICSQILWEHCGTVSLNAFAASLLYGNLWDTVCCCLHAAHQKLSRHFCWESPAEPMKAGVKPDSDPQSESTLRAQAQGRAFKKKKKKSQTTSVLFAELYALQTCKRQFEKLRRTDADRRKLKDCVRSHINENTCYSRFNTRPQQKDKVGWRWGKCWLNWRKLSSIIRREVLTPSPVLLWDYKSNYNGATVAIHNSKIFNTHKRYVVSDSSAWIKLGWSMHNFHDCGITHRSGIKSRFQEERERLSGVNAKPSVCHFTNTSALTAK